MTATDIYALYILCCLLMTEVVAKVILIACKPVLSDSAENLAVYGEEDVNTRIPANGQN